MHLSSAPHSLWASGNLQTQLQAKRRTRLSAPESTPPGPRAPVQLVSLGVLRQPLGGRTAARGKGPRLRNPARVLLPPRGQLLTNVPHPAGPLPGDSLPALAAIPPRTPSPRNPAPCCSLTHAQYIPPMATLPLSSPHPGPPLYTTPPFKGPEIQCLRGFSGWLTCGTGEWKREGSTDEWTAVFEMGRETLLQPYVNEFIWPLRKWTYLQPAQSPRFWNLQPVNFYLIFLKTNIELPASYFAK